MFVSGNYQICQNLHRELPALRGGPTQELLGLVPAKFAKYNFPISGTPPPLRVAAGSRVNQPCRRRRSQRRRSEGPPLPHGPRRVPAPPPLRSLKIVAVAARPAHPACLRGNPRRFVVGAACVQARRRVRKKEADGRGADTGRGGTGLAGGDRAAADVARSYVGTGGRRVVCGLRVKAVRRRSEGWRGQGC